MFQFLHLFFDLIYYIRIFLLHLLTSFDFKISVRFHFEHYIPFWALYIAQNVTHK